jgi:hypothetical protein
MFALDPLATAYVAPKFQAPLGRTAGIERPGVVSGICPMLGQASEIRPIPGQRYL